MSSWSYLKPFGAPDSDCNLLLPDPIQCCKGEIVAANAGVAETTRDAEARQRVDSPTISPISTLKQK